MHKTVNKIKHLIEVDKFKPKDIAVLGVDSMRPSANNSTTSMTKELNKLGVRL